MRLRKGKNGFTLIELLVVVAIISVLVALLLPALASARDQAWKIDCLSNLGQIGKALYGYGEENYGSLPPWWTTNDTSNSHCNWVAYLVCSKYYPAVSVFPKCKTFNRRYLNGGGGYQTYGLNEQWATLYKGGPRYDSGPSAVEIPSNTCAVYETALWGGAQWRKYGGFYSLYWNYPYYSVHGKGSNYLFYDWHVEWRKKGGPYPLFLNPGSWGYTLPPENDTTTM